MHERLVAAEARVDTVKLRSGALEAEEWRRVSDGLGSLADLPIHLDDASRLTVGELRSRARRLVTQQGVEIVIVDYLQLLHWHARTKDRVAEVSEISRGLKELAGELGVVVLAGSQLNRASEGRVDRRPVLSDLRESGTLEQDANIVLLLDREELHKPSTSRRGEADVIVAKNRSGPTGDVHLAWRGAWTMFADLDRHHRDR